MNLGENDGMRASLDKQPAEVAAMFDRTAERYDLANDVLSLGQSRLWRRAVARAVDARAGERVLDLAAGTGTSSTYLAATGAHCVACDFSFGMLRVGARRLGSAHARGVSFVGGDATALPFADASFDAVTISFGLRNLTDTELGLAEMLRVTRPGGRLVICEFSRPPFRPWRALYERYLIRALPAAARLVSSNPEAYAYLVESIQDWPDQAMLARRLHEVGWEAVSWRNMSGGIVAIHRARRAPG